MSEKQQLMKGMTTWVNPYGIKIVRLHYSCDPQKDPDTEEGKNWYKTERAKTTSDDWWNQEYEIDFGAKSGSKIYHMTEEATVCKRFPIPHSWTRFMLLDVHPRTPHAMLWVAMNPDNEAFIYRELWPSKIYGKPGNIPEDDNIFKVKFYVQSIKWLESDENPENCGKAEEIHERIIDYAARAFGKGDADNPDQVNLQQRYEEISGELEYPLYFTDCKKDNEAGREVVNDWLSPRPTLDAKGEVVSRSRLQIFDDLPEVIWQLKNNRFKQLTASQVETKDPEAKVLQKRNHLTDLVKYWAMSDPQYYEKKQRHSTWKPAVKGIAR